MLHTIVTACFVCIVVAYRDIMTIANSLLHALLLMTKATRSPLRDIKRGREPTLAMTSWHVVNDTRYQTAGPPRPSNNSVRRRASIFFVKLSP